MRIIYFIPDGYPTYRPDISVLFGKYLARCGLDCDLVAQQTEIDELKWTAGVVYLGPTSGNPTKRQLLGILHDITQLIRTRPNYDAIQVRDKPIFGALAMLWAIVHRKPFIYWMSFPICETLISLSKQEGIRRGAVRYLSKVWRGYVGYYLQYKVILPYAHHAFVQSDKMLQDIQAKGIDISSMTAVPMCIDPERFRESETDRNSPLFRDRRVIAYLGTCIRMRRIDFLLDVMVTIRNRYPNILLMLIGDAESEEDKQWLRQQIDSRDLSDAVIVTGWLQSSQAQSLLRSAEVAIALMAPDPILDSTTPTKLVEYLALGLPVVANDHPDQKRVIEESGAGICVPFSTSDFVDAISRLLDDKELSRRLAQGGPGYVNEKRSYPLTARKLADVYRTILRAK